MRCEHRASATRFVSGGWGRMHRPLDQEGRRVARVRLAGLPRHPGRVASGGEAEANVAWPQTRRGRNLHLCENEPKRGGALTISPGLSPAPVVRDAARTHPTGRSTLAPNDLRAERVRGNRRAS